MFYNCRVQWDNENKLRLLREQWANLSWLSTLGCCREAIVMNVALSKRWRIKPDTDRSSVKVTIEVPCLVSAFHQGSHSQQL